MQVVGIAQPVERVVVHGFRVGMREQIMVRLNESGCSLQVVCSNQVYSISSQGCLGVLVQTVGSEGTAGAARGCWKAPHSSWVCAGCAVLLCAGTLFGCVLVA